MVSITSLGFPFVDVYYDVEGSRAGMVAGGGGGGREGVASRGLEYMCSHGNPTYPRRFPVLDADNPVADTLS